jgi:hypothetical protein
MTGDLKSTTTVGPQNDCVNAISIHPYSSIIASTTGQRHFDQMYEDNIKNDSHNSDESVHKSTVQIWNINRALGN